MSQPRILQLRINPVCVCVRGGRRIANVEIHPIVKSKGDIWP